MTAGAMNAPVTDAADVDYELLRRQLRELIADEPDPLANTANFVGLLYGALPDVNWLGVYVLRGEELVLGPFQGKPACVRLPLGKGVCGTAALGKQTLRVPDVREFAGHIACDPVSLSELVVPLVRRERVIGVLDIDSPRTRRFDERDQAGIEALCADFVDDLSRKVADGFI
jgi:GAF domain-containing protein